MKNEARLRDNDKKFMSYNTFWGWLVVEINTTQFFNCANLGDDPLGKGMCD